MTRALVVAFWSVYFFVISNVISLWIKGDSLLVRLLILLLPAAAVVVSEWKRRERRYGPGVPGPRSVRRQSVVVSPTPQA